MITRAFVSKPLTSINPVLYVALPAPPMELNRVASRFDVSTMTVFYNHTSSIAILFLPAVHVRKVQIKQRTECVVSTSVSYEMECGSMDVITMNRTRNARRHGERKGGRREMGHCPPLPTGLNTPFRLRVSLQQVKRNAPLEVHRQCARPVVGG